MQNAAQAYGSVARQIANPRELEADARRLALAWLRRREPVTTGGVDHWLWRLQVATNEAAIRPRFSHAH